MHLSRALPYFRAGWRDSRPKFRNTIENNREGGRLPPRKILGFPEIFAFIKRNSCFRKIRRFSCNAYYFLVSVAFSCRSEVLVFRFSQELNAVRSENSELSRRISRILPVFYEILVYLRKMIVD